MSDRPGPGPGPAVAREILRSAVREQLERLEVRWPDRTATEFVDRLLRPSLADALRALADDLDGQAAPPMAPGWVNLFTRIRGRRAA